MHPEGLNEEPFSDPLGESAALIAAGRAEEVVTRCQALLARGRGGTLTRVALGRALVASGRPQEALDVLREANHSSPNTAEVVLAFGEALAAADALPTAIAEFQRAARLAPDDGRPHWQMAQLWLAAGEADRAEAAAEIASHLGGVDDDALNALRESASRIRAAARADAGYVRQLFNQFAPDYDVRMRSRLGYAAPEILLDIAGHVVDPRDRFDVLDLGCGTGLSGLAFKLLAKRLVGVDLSPKMLDVARGLGIYDQLVEGDVEFLPPSVDGPFNLVVAADVLVYLGYLEPLFAAVRARLSSGGLWLFTTERSGEVDFERGPKRRYRHSADYLKRLAAAHGFDVLTLIECVTRHEAGVPVPSWASAFRASG